MGFRRNVNTPDRDSRRSLSDQSAIGGNKFRNARRTLDLVAFDERAKTGENVKTGERCPVPCYAMDFQVGANRLNQENLR